MVVMSWWCHTSRFYGAGYVLSAASSPRDGTPNEAKERESEIRGLQQLKRNGVFQITYLCTAHLIFFFSAWARKVCSHWQLRVNAVYYSCTQNDPKIESYSQCYTWWRSRSNINYLLWSTMTKLSGIILVVCVCFMCDVMCQVYHLLAIRH